jgi:hypothetical protein
MPRIRARGANDACGAKRSVSPLIKSLIGASMVLLIGLLALFPTFAVMAHYIVGGERYG